MIDANNNALILVAVVAGALFAAVAMVLWWREYYRRGKTEPSIKAISCYKVNDIMNNPFRIQKISSDAM
ncbi:hypothetical protein H6F77_14325 [Microcoleus sp. FACHB-831]|uniref:hypothetical protein n=1 Tax=Microcoleus sp. FACHB-831 TaxID=2692827 RepID=UPI00168770AE|nr:hypothetical protein [Microcoleus sp. FACHB-831]MBD1922250.1 hypothetical protein [Microcoleus sp. FACHB-831]